MDQAIQVRKSIFETNSSSTHSVVIAPEGADFVMPKDLPDVIKLESDEFGWEQKSYMDFFSRLSYAFTYAINYSREEDVDNLRKIVTEFTGKETEMEEGKEHGYIDHQSVEGRMGQIEEAFKDAATLKRFLFGKGSSFETDNDNH